jgi:AraC-like DNA-binding protein
MEKLDFRVVSRGGTEIEIVKDIPLSLRRLAPSAYENYISRAHCGDFLYNVFRGNGFTIWFSIYHAYKEIYIKGWGELPILELHIPLFDEFISKFEGVLPYALRRNQYDLSFFPHINNEVKLYEGMRSRTFDVHYTIPYLRKFQGISKRLANFLDAVEKGKEPVSLLNMPQFLSTEMIRLINSMVYFDLMDEAAPFFFEGAILQLTTYVVERLAGIDSSDKKSFSNIVKERTIQAKELMMEDLSIRYSIEDLAKKVLLSDCTLQDCFKHLFGSTIFHYSQVARMERAGDLLILDKDLTIQEVAEAVGYKNNSNFTNAFKKEFGCTPDYHRRHGRLSQPESHIKGLKDT